MSIILFFYVLSQWLKWGRTTNLSRHHSVTRCLALGLPKYLWTLMFLVFSTNHLFTFLGINQENFISDTLFWQDQVRHYWRLMNVDETEIRNVMDMNAFCGGFAVALSTWPIWVMNIVPISMNNTLSAIYNRGLIGAFHDW